MVFSVHLHSPGPLGGVEDRGLRPRFSIPPTRPEGKQISSDTSNILRVRRPGKKSILTKSNQLVGIHVPQWYNTVKRYRAQKKLSRQRLCQRQCQHRRERERDRHLKQYSPPPPPPPPPWAGMGDITKPEMAWKKRHFRLFVRVKPCSLMNVKRCHVIGVLLRNNYSQPDLDNHVTLTVVLA